MIATAKVVIFIFGGLWMLISLIPLIRDDNWAFRVFEYPRAQKLVINALILAGFLFLADFSEDWDVVFCVLLSCNLIYLGWQVWPYTVLSRSQMKRSERHGSDSEFSLMICNVYQDNRDVKSCIAAIRENDPDMVMLVETDQWWKDELDKDLKSIYPEGIYKPLENTYGMLLYSRCRLIDPEIKFLIENDVPSIHTKVQLRSGRIFQMYGLHPKPPVPQENPRSTERDAEMLLVAKEAKGCKLPVIVAGDMNDVAWSYTTDLFLKTSGLLDPRRGRGFYNTFHAHHWFFRWPLDHIFCSTHFTLGSLKRLKSVGSDHFPILVHLVLENEKIAENKREALEADEGEKEMADEKIEKAR